MQAKLLSRLIHLIALGSTVSMAYAQDTSTDAEQSSAVLDIVDVTALQTEGNDRYITDTTSTATGLNLSLTETPQSVSVVTYKKFEDEGSTTVEDALSRTNGLTIWRDGNAYRFQSRGFEMDQIQEDGLSNYGQGADVNQYFDASSFSDLAIYDHFEIQRGPSGFMQGSGEPGGTVNMVRKRPTEETQITSETTVGSWKNFRQTLDASGALNESGTVRGRVVAAGEMGESFQDYREDSSGTLYGILEANITPSTLVTVGAAYQKTSETPDPHGIPLTSDGGDLHLDDSTFLGADWNDYDRTKKNVFAELSQELGDNWQLEIKANHTKSTSELRQIGYVARNGIEDVNNATVTGNNGVGYNNDNKQMSFEAKLSGDFEALGRDHQAFVGLNYQRDEYDSLHRRVASSDEYNVYTFDGGDIAELDWSEGNLSYKYRQQFEYTQKAAFFGTRLGILDDLHAIVGGRYTKWEYAYDKDWMIWNGSVDNDPNSTGERDEKHFTPYFGLTYEFTPNQSVYASYSEIFKPNTSKDINGDYLDPVVGGNIELGYKAEIIPNTLQATAAVYRITQKNRAIGIDSDGDGWNDYSVPEGKVRSQGIELEISGEPVEGWNINAGYTYTQTKYLETENESRNRIAGLAYAPYVPRHSFKLYTTYNLPIADQRWTIGGGTRIQSKNESLWGIKQGGFAVWDASVKYDFSKATSLQLNINNIFDKRYYETHRTRSEGYNNFYGEPRNFMLTFKHRF